MLNKEVISEKKKDYDEAENNKAAINLSERKAEFREKLKRVQERKGCIPKKGEGTQFHVAIETIEIDSVNGMKKSKSFNQIIDVKMFIVWLGNAQRLSYSFGVLHDASVFMRDKNSLIKALKKYSMESSFDRLEYSVKNLATSKGMVNDLMKEYYVKIKNKRKKVQESKKGILD